MMPYTYKNAEQESDVDAIIDDLLENSADDLRDGNVMAVYERILNSEVGREMEGDRLGKISEVLLDLYPNLLRSMSELPMGMFYGCNLTELTIPVNVEKFGMGVFALSDIRHLIYEGTRNQWDALVRNSASQWDIMTPQGQTVKDIVRVDCSDAENIYGLNEDVNEAMTKKETLFKYNVLKYLREDGFPTFADYLDNFHFNFVTSADFGRPFVAAISPERGIVLINPNVDVEGLSMLLRHEAAHQIFKHMDHMFAKLKKLGIETPSQLAYELSNVVGDYHISNYIYDEEDKKIAKRIKIENGEVFEGLVTELDFPENPEYWTMTFDELWDIFVAKYNKEDLEQKIEEQPNMPQELSDEYIEGWNALIDAYERGEITKDQIERWALTH